MFAVNQDDGSESIPLNCSIMSIKYDPKNIIPFSRSIPPTGNEN